MSDKMYRAAAIGRTGRGNWGHGLHLGLKNHPRIEVVAVADEDAEERQAKQAELAAPRAYADWREMLAAEQPEVVTVGPRWTDCHLEMVLACLEVGAHVYCEKPMTWSLAEGDQIVAKAEATGLKVAVAHQGAYLPLIRHVKEVLAQGRIGAVQAIRAHGKQDRRGGGEDMIVLGTHSFNMMRLFAGDVAWMTAHVAHEGRALQVDDVREAAEPVGPVAGDCINSYFAFKSGVAGFFDSRKYAEGGGQRMGMEIEGSEGVIALRGGGSGPAMLYPHPVFDPTAASQQWSPLRRGGGRIPEHGQRLGGRRFDRRGRSRPRAAVERARCGGGLGDDLGGLRGGDYRRAGGVSHAAARASVGCLARGVIG